MVGEREAKWFSVTNEQAVATDNKSKLASQLLYDVEAPKITIKHVFDDPITRQFTH